MKILNYSCQCTEILTNFKTLQYTNLLIQNTKNKTNPIPVDNKNFCSNGIQKCSKYTFKVKSFSSKIKHFAFTIHCYTFEEISSFKFLYASDCLFE